HYDVIVEVDERNTAPCAAPAANARCPVIELGIGITACVELGRAMQSRVDEVRRQFLRVPELPCRIGEDERAMVGAQYVVKFLAEIRWMSHLERVSIADAPSVDRLEQRALLESMVVMARAVLGGERIPRKHAHEAVEPLGLETDVAGSCHKNGPVFAPSASRPPAK